MNCPACNTQNTPGAQYCRNCGHDLTSPMDLWPEHGFRPFDVYPPKIYIFGLTVYACFAILEIGMFLFGAYSLFELLYYPSDNYRFTFYLTIYSICTGIGFFGSLMFIWRLISIKKRANALKHKSIYFSSQTYRFSYTFFVQNKKFGLTDSELKVLIPAKYEYLKWKKVGKILYATEGGRTFLIDTKGNRI